MTSPNASGRKVAQYRKIMNYTQPELASILSALTGEKLTAQDIARMEAFGKPNAANAKKKKPPSSAVIAIIRSDLENRDMTEKRDKEPSVTEESRRKLAKISEYYQRLGLLDDDAIKPSAMINSLRMRIEVLEQKLEGESKVDVPLMKGELLKLKEERQEIIRLIKAVRKMIRDIKAGKLVDFQEVNALLGGRAI